LLRTRQHAPIDRLEGNTAIAPKVDLGVIAVTRSAVITPRCGMGAITVRFD